MPAMVSSERNQTLPLGYRGVRAAILIALKKAPGLTTRELAGRLSASLNAVRHHLKELASQGLVHYQREQRGVGAPTFSYTLTPAGESLFPRRYEATLVGLLEELVERQGRAAVIAMLEARYANLAERLEEKLAGASPTERLNLVAQLLSEDGYMAESGIGARAGTLVEHNCAIQAVAERFPEICTAEARFLSTVLGGVVERKSHILNGCSACEYHVRFDSDTQAASAADDLGSRPAAFAHSEEKA